MTSFRVLVVDDEPLARERLTHFLSAERDMELMGEAGSGPEALRLLKADPPDLLLLDIQMPGMSGLDLLRAVGPLAMPPTIFITAYDRHALEAFELCALDYLLKPCERERFQSSLDRVRRLRSEGKERGFQSQMETLLASLRAEAPARLERLFVRVGDTQRLVRVEDVRWIEAQDNYVRLHLASEVHLVRQTLSSLETRLDARRFRRIHRSTLVNLDYMKEIQPWFNGELAAVLQDGTTLAISRSYRSGFQELG
ncbi:MAG TPA: LytTR family DNA-binding domain-containing protein [Holophagaceae bacterium]|jgi:two-component system LytT family response regulator|nr:LytTR family DNA-binding domain-containing protein [Holophagaceae bacterium]